MATRNQSPEQKARDNIDLMLEESGWKVQSQEYAAATLKWVKNNAPLPFVYENTGVITRFTDGHDPKPRSREVFTFHRPDTLQEWLTKPASLRGRLHNLPALDHAGLRDCQITAIEKLEAGLNSFREVLGSLGKAG